MAHRPLRAAKAFVETGGADLKPNVGLQVSSVVGDLKADTRGWMTLVDNDASSHAKASVQEMRARHPVVSGCRDKPYGAALPLAKLHLAP